MFGHFTGSTRFYLSRSRISSKNCNAKWKSICRQFSIVSETFPVEKEHLLKYLKQLEHEHSPQQEETSTSNSLTAARRRHHLDPELKRLKYEWITLQDSLRDLEELQKQESDKELLALAAEERIECLSELTRLEQSLLSALVPQEPLDECQDVLIEISSAVGGLESCLFAAELVQMYLNYAAFRQWQAEVVERDNIQHTNATGLRSCLLSVSGPQVYRWLAHEGGVHRVQRKPVTAKGDIIYTSTVVVVVTPVPDPISVQLQEKDLQITLCKSSGPGGMGVNAHETTVRLLHIPTNTVVECQQQRTAIHNELIARKKLQALLFEKQQQAQQQDMDHDKRRQRGTGNFNEKIRTYQHAVWRVDEHRLKRSFHQLKEVLQGRDQLHEILACLVQHDNLLRVQHLLKSCSGQSKQ